jgi:hypothetical protein
MLLGVCAYQALRILTLADVTGAVDTVQREKLLDLVRVCDLDLTYHVLGENAFVVTSVFVAWHPVLASSNASFTRSLCVG